MNDDIDLNDGTHSRFDFEHYKSCQPCYEDHLDFMDELRQDEQHDIRYARGQDDQE